MCEALTAEIEMVEVFIVHLKDGKPSRYLKAKQNPSNKALQINNSSQQEEGIGQLYINY